MPQHTHHDNTEQHTTTHGDRQTDRQRQRKQEKARRGTREDKTEDKKREKKRRQDERKQKKTIIIVWFLFLFKITRPSNNFEFSKEPDANPEHDFFPGNVLFVKIAN